MTSMVVIFSLKNSKSSVQSFKDILLSFNFVCSREIASLIGYCNITSAPSHNPTVCTSCGLTVALVNSVSFNE